MAASRRCTICGRRFRPDVRSRRHQRTCSKRCRKRAKRLRDREHKRRYRDTGLGRERRRQENERTRDRLGWTEYMRFWRKADPVRTARGERMRAQRYYAQHRDEVLAKRRAQRAAQSASGKARSH